MGKTLVYLLCSLFLLTSVSATTFGYNNLNDLGTFKQGEQIRVSQVCSNSTYINISSIAYPNSSVAVSNIEMTSAGSGEFYYDFSLTQTTGEYQVRGISDGCENTFATTFEVTYTGENLSTSQSILYGLFLTLLVLTFVSCFVAMGFLPAKNERDEEGRILSITYLKYFRNVLGMVAYFLFIGINYITSNLAFAFLGEELVANTLFMIFKISFGVAPLVVILWLVWMIVSMFHDKQFQKLLNRGMFPGGNV